MASTRGIFAHNVVIVTASTEKQAKAVENELAARKRAGAYGEDISLFAVPDPQNARVGSGGATLHALLVVAELMAGGPHKLADCRVLMIHSGGDSQRLPAQSVCGKAWSALPTQDTESGELQAPIDLLVTKLMGLFSSVRAGLIVASSDVLLLVPTGFAVHWPQTGVTGLAIPSDKSFGPHHGCYQVSAQRAAEGADAANCYRVSRFWQKASVPELTAGGAVRAHDNAVLIDSGVVYFSPPATAELLALCAETPLDCCTYRGLDMGRPPLRIELYSDMMMALDGGLGLSKQQYHATPLPDASSSPARFAAARDILWDRLTPHPFFALVLEGGGFAHVGTSAEYLHLLTRPSRFAELYGLGSASAVYVQDSDASDAGPDGVAVASGEPSAKRSRLNLGGAAAAGGGAVGVTAATVAAGGQPLASLQAESTVPTFTVLNTIMDAPPAAGGSSSFSPFGAGSVVEHSRLSGRWTIGDGCLVSSVRTLPSLVVRGGTALQELRVTQANGSLGRVVSVLGVSDGIKDAYGKPSARINGVPWHEFLAVAGAGPEDVWPGAGPSYAGCTIWTAKLWPVTPLEATGTDADLACLWPQWAAPLKQGEAADPRCVAARAACTSPAVLAAWRSSQRLSLKDILAAADANTEFAWRRDLRGRIDAASLVLAAGGTATSGASSVAALVRRLGRAARGTGCPPGLPANYEGALQAAAAAAGASSGVGAGLVVTAAAAAAASATVASPSDFTWAALRALDRVAASCPADVAARSLWVQALLMWAVAGWGTNAEWSGPAYHGDWAHAFGILEKEGALQRAFSHRLGAGVQASKGSESSPLHGAGASAPAGAVAADGSSMASSTATASRARATAMAALSRLRDAWSASPHGLGRAARHYERAAQLLTSQCVFTASVAAPTPFTDAATAAAVDGATGAGPWVFATAPVRVDLAGGWSDTPPITYEAPPAPPGPGASARNADARVNDPALVKVAGWCAAGGGLVINAAISVDGRRPLGSRVRRVALTSPTQPAIVIRTRAEGRPVEDEDGEGTSAGMGGAGDVPMGAASDATAPGGTVVVSSTSVCSLSDLADYCQPRAEGALVKCALLGLPGLLDAGSATPLRDQLAAALGSSGVGLEIETWSLLPHGSGLGTSSILAGTLLAALAGALGRSYDRVSLSHLVLGLEAMLSTGGGWQDQIGGLWPGVKASCCAPSLPLGVAVQPLSDSSQPFFLSDRIFLVYTGKTRLAKNLLQTVLRQWAGQEPEVTSTVAALRGNAVAMATALACRDAEGAGAALAAYWDQKQRMAPGAEPAEVAAMRGALAPLVTGTSLAGAGGGGFLIGLARVPAPSPKDLAARMDAVLRAHPATARLPFSVHAAEVDPLGLVVAVEGQKQQ